MPPFADWMTEAKDQKQSNTDNQKAKSKENQLLALNFAFTP